MIRFALFLVLIIPSASYAQLVRCGDTWTNKKCNQEIQESLPEQVVTDNGERTADSFKEKRSLLVSFQSYRRAIQREADFYIDTLAVDDICLSSTSSVADCQAIIDRFEERLVNLAKVKKKATEESTKQESKKEETTVVINNNRDPYWNYYYWRKNRRVRPTQPPTSSSIPRPDPGYTLSEQTGGTRQESTDSATLSGMQHQ
ncbi:MAG: hypothetical protein KDD70_12025 [Bdellovibrionales bacterium]|nr:hypothetical protein [Bdellovibrionales bacterium]